MLPFAVEWKFFVLSPWQRRRHFSSSFCFRRSLHVAARLLLLSGILAVFLKAILRPEDRSLLRLCWQAPVSSILSGEQINMKILAVVVRYNTPLQASAAVQGVSDALSTDPQLRESYEFLVWDNSPERLENPELPIAYDYDHSGMNLGVSGAYNQAMRRARQRGCKWMLLLDQDTEINAPFLRNMARWSEMLRGRQEIAVIAPTVRVGKRIVSPRQYLFNRHRSYSNSIPGVASGEAFAINSGSIMRVAALEQIGGFSADFWLDYADIYVCHQLFLRGKKIWRATDTELKHDMTLMNYDRPMTAWRYRNFSYAETAFNDLYKGRLENGAQDLRLLARAVRQRMNHKNSALSRITFAELIYRLRVRRRKRIQNWFTESEKQRVMNIRSLSAAPATERKAS